MKHENFIILAGGMSSRMKKQTISNEVGVDDIKQANSRVKSLIGVGNGDRPILDYLIYNAKKSGYKNIYIICNEMSLPMFQEFYGAQMNANNFKGLSISYGIQYIPEERKKPLGTADALEQVLDQFPSLVDNYFTVCNSDNLYSISAMTALRDTLSHNAFINYNRSNLKFTEERISRFSVSKLDESNHLENIIEKPSLDQVDENKDSNGDVFVSMNIFKLFGKDIYTHLKECPIHPHRKEKELPTAILNMVNSGVRVKGILFAEHVPDLTAKEDIPVVRAFLKEYYSVLDW